MTDFRKIRYKNVQYFNLGHAHKPKFGFVFFVFATGRSNGFFPFSRPFDSLPLAFHILCGYRKKLGVNYGPFFYQHHTIHTPLRWRKSAVRGTMDVKEIPKPELKLVTKF